MVFRQGKRYSLKTIKYLKNALVFLVVSGIYSTHGPSKNKKKQAKKKTLSFSFQACIA